MKKKTSGDLIIFEGKKQILLSLDEYSINGNQIEICYREDYEDGWGFGGGEFFSTFDIKAMADCIRSVIYMRETKASYTCQNKVFRIEIEYDASGDTYSFTAALIETLHRDFYISITKSELTRIALDEYIQPFFEWERKYPI